MKKLLLTLGLGLASSAAFANPPINFHGTITAGGTCPITIVDPGSGGVVLPRVVVGSFHPEFFTTAGTKTPAVSFALRVDPSTCTISPGDQGYVTFDANYGPVGTNLYGLRPGGEASNLGLAIMDKSRANLAPGTESAAYPLDDTKPTDMLFLASYESTATGVTPGHAQSEVVFTVDIR